MLPSFLLFKIKNRVYETSERRRYSYAAPNSFRRPPHKLDPVGLLPLEVNSPGFGEMFTEKFPDEARRILDEADNAVELKFNLLGSGWVDLKAHRSRTDLEWLNGERSGEPARVKGMIPWHFDFKTRFGWKPETYFSDIKIGQTPGVDIKVPWELSRVQYFVTLGQAYRLTENEKYAESYFSHVEDWIRENPPKFGVNWACPMDVALRAANWLLGWEFFRMSPSKPAAFEDKFSSTLWEHGLHIRRHLEWGAGVSSNHYLSDLLGLVYLGHAFRQEEWLGFAIAQLENEMQSQVHPDGFDYETSTAYHRLVLELFFYATLLTERRRPNSGNFSASYKTRLRAMFEALDALASETGNIPLIGDNDSGRVHVFLTREDRDIRYLSDMGALYFKDSRLKREDWPPSSELAWLFGFSGLETFRSMPGVRSAEAPSRLAGPSGIAVLRGKKDVLVFSAQQNGVKGVGGHTHNDKLSFTLSVESDDFLADPGTFVYTSDPSKRNLFRSTLMHNTVEVDGEEQNRIHHENLFMLYEDSHVSVENEILGKEITARHDGYKRLPDPVVHRRTIRKGDRGDSWILRDEFEGREQHRLRWTFVCDPRVASVELKSGSAVIEGASGRLQIQSKALEMEFQIEQGFCSPQYGTLVPAKLIRGDLISKLPLAVEFSLLWTPRQG